MEISFHLNYLCLKLELLRGIFFLIARIYFKLHYSLLAVDTNIVYGYWYSISVSFQVKEGYHCYKIRTQKGLRRSTKVLFSISNTHTIKIIGV